jgi:endonuclease/exonuclease/phosphatase family metal-dependent hydrolase
VGSLRVVSYNVRSLRDDRRAVSRLLFGLDADVVCVQEAPRLLFWRWRGQRMARRAGLRFVAGGRTTGGSALLVGPRMEVVETREVRFPKSPELFQRGVTLARLRTPRGESVTVASTHLGLDADERVRHLDDLLAAVGRLPSPVVVLAGDLNEGPDGPVWRELAGSWVDSGAGTAEPTFPARRPRRRIDGVFVRGPALVTGCRVVEHPDVLVASDHRPVVADLDLGVGGRRR